MYRESFEDALTNIDDGFIEEAIKFDKKSRITPLAGSKAQVVKAAAAAVTTFAVLGLSVYAATVVLRKVEVQEHSISVGNTEYVDDAAIASMLENIDKEPGENKVDHVDGDSSVNWVSKDVSRIGSTVENTRYTYKSMDKALKDYPLAGWVGNVPGEETSVVITLTKMDGFNETSIDAFLSYESGTIGVCCSKATGNIAEDAAYSIALSNTSNTREYKADDGTVYTLVDQVKDVTKTYVLISYDGYDGSISFEGLTEAQIHSVLDKLN